MSMVGGPFFDSGVALLHGLWAWKRLFLCEAFIGANPDFLNAHVTMIYM